MSPVTGEVKLVVKVMYWTFSSLPIELLSAENIQWRLQIST